MAVISALVGAFAVCWIASAQRPEFEVASVKTSAGGPFQFAPQRTGDRVSIHMTHIGSVIPYAYHIPFYRLVGYEQSRIAYDWYDIDAKAPAGASDEQVRQMFQALLEDRFQLKFHRETREMAQFELTIAKAKAKMTEASDDEVMTVEIEGRKLAAHRGNCIISAWLSGDHLTCHAVTAEKIASTIEGALHGPVADHTGLTGLYDLDLRFVSENQRAREDAEPGPPLAAALQEELGLKLEKGKGPVEVMVIDHLEKPSEN